MTKTKLRRIPSYLFLIVSAFVLVMLSLAVYGQSGNFNLAG